VWATPESRASLLSLVHSSDPGIELVSLSVMSFTLRIVALIIGSLATLSEIGILAGFTQLNVPSDAKFWVVAGSVGGYLWIVLFVLIALVVADIRDHQEDIAERSEQLRGLR
jgi:hypothetical protein